MIQAEEATEYLLVILVAGSENMNLNESFKISDLFWMFGLQGRQTFEMLI